jgi:serine/threonine protein phosphatase PrpC
MPATWTALSASVRGALHESRGQVNQDAVRVHRAGDCLFLAVADGHGSTRSFRSDRGAALATDCALRVLRDFTWRNGLDAPLSSVRRQMERRLPRALVVEWHRAVRADLARDPFSALDFAAFPEKAPVVRRGEELPFGAYLAYGATLIVAAVTPRFILYAQLGDGDILLVQADGSVSRPWSREHAFFSTETVSLCSAEAITQFKVRVQPRRGGAPALILLATDGYSNCFGDDAGFFTVGSDLLAYLRTNGAALVQEKLAHWLSESSRDGSGDDITVALAARPVPS